MTSTFQGQLSRERRRSGLFAMEIERLSRGFAAEGIECVALKGAGLTQNVYTSPAERFLSDVDLLVSPDRVDATLAHLLEHGYANPWSMEALLGYYEQGTVKPVIDSRPNGNKQVVLNFITPHQKWGIHSTYTDNLMMLTLSRGGPIVWLSEVDAAKAGIVDNDWVEAYNVNGALVARAVVSQRMKEGTLFMYHAQEKIVNVPGSEMTGQRGGIHNSVTRAVLKPTHMIGGYAQQAYGFNYRNDRHQP